ncbi:MAG: DEAD/DEAH box helicase family protein, partial [Firmicutes bacterium]|nr:DEAD/DEAH box helicase family protein [Bacillota bacterium]
MTDVNDINDVNNVTYALTASVAVDKCLYPFDMLFDYLVPQSMEKDISVGQAVMVPFGAGNKKRIGTVFGLKRVGLSVPPKKKLKPILSIGENCAVMNGEQLELAQWLKDNTFCTYYDAIRTILPPGLTFSVNAKYTLLKGNPAKLNGEEKALLSDLKKCKTEKDMEILISGLKDGRLLKALEIKGFIEENHRMKRHVGDETQQMVRLRESFEQNDRLAKLTAKQRAVINTLVDYQAASVKELSYICGVTSVVIRNLVKYGLLEEYSYTVSRAESTNAASVKSPESIILSQEQQGAFQSLLQLMRGDEPKCALLYGVTGSGKTSVFLKLIDKAIKAGRTALMLVPEISLTPQTVKNFQSIFGNTVAIIHSNLS